MSKQAITIWRDGWKLWQSGDAYYAENDPDWVMTIPLDDILTDEAFGG